MATTSEIQVTEAYIGLLGRAPDPAGLAYWAKQLDDAIAAGEDAAVALKKLTNDITLSDEWDSGIGANDGSTEAGSEAIVNKMYQNLFERDAKTAELDYWAPKIVSGEFTASEMAVALIQGAGETDGDVLGYKQKAATYYVESVSQDNFSRESAKDSVDSVDGPKTLADSKEATDYVATGVGKTTALTAATDTVTMTAGSDTVTGTFGSDATFQAADKILDTSAADQDVLTVSGDATNLAITAANITEVETINYNLAKTVGSGATITMTGDLSADTFNLDAAAKVEVAGLEVDGETVLSVTGGDLVGDINTTDITSLTLAGLGNNKSAVTITGDADLATLTISGEANDAGVTVDLANNDTTVAITGEAGAGTGNDMATIKANGDVALSLTNMEFLNVEGNTGAVEVAITGGADKYTVSGSENVTLTGDTAMFNDATLVNSATGTVTVDITSDSTDLDIGGFANIDVLDLSSDMATRTITLDSGQDVTISKAQSGTMTFADDDASNDATLAITVDGGTANSLAVGTINTTNIAKLTINSSSDTMTGLGVDATGGNDASLTVVSTNDVSGTSLKAKSVTVDVGDLTLSNDVTSTAGNIELTSDEGVAANDISATGGGVTVTAGDDITTTDISAAAGKDVKLTATDMAITGDVTGDDITLAADNDATANVAESISGSITAANDVTITDGTFTAANLTATAGSVTVSGDAGITVSTTTTAAENVVVTSTGNVDFSSIDSTVLVASAATGNVKGEFDSVTATSAVTVATGSGNDTIETDDSNLFTVSLGDGVDTLTITSSGNDSSFKTGDGKDNVIIKAIGGGSTVETGGGDDTASIDGTAMKSTVKTGEGNDTVTLSAANNNDIDIQFGAGDGDTLKLASAAYNDGDLSWSDVEKVDITAGGNTIISAAQLAGDNTFELVSDGTNGLLIEASDANDTTMDASNVTTSFGTSGAIDMNGAAGNDVITGNVTDNVINGAGGKDTIKGGIGSDTLGGNDGDDKVYGEAGTDTIYGGAGNDTLDGGAARDIIYADNGIDTMTGGDGNDSFVISVMTGDSSANESLALSRAHTITDFDGTHAGDNDVLSIQHANDAGTNNDSVYDGTNYDDIGDVITAANTYFSSDGTGAGDTNDVFLAYNAYGSGNGILLVDDDNDGVFEDGETMIILTGINTIDEANNVIDSLDLGT
jgi:Ca2+-binding RTX toxin-like protein